MPNQSKQQTLEERISLKLSEGIANEQERRELINSFIASIPVNRQLQLRRLQFRIDGILHRHSQLGGLVVLERMMFDMLAELSAALAGEERGTGQEQKALSDNAYNVIPFRLNQKQ